MYIYNDLCSVFFLQDADNYVMLLFLNSVESELIYVKNKGCHWIRVCDKSLHLVSSGKEKIVQIIIFLIVQIHLKGIRKRINFLVVFWHFFGGVLFSEIHISRFSQVDRWLGVGDTILVVPFLPSFFSLSLLPLFTPFFTFLFSLFSILFFLQILTCSDI